jgi:hypothetical protein
MVKFYLDSVEYENPIGWDEISTKIVRNFDINALLVYQDLSLTFTGAGYDYLFSKLNDQGFCSIVELSIVYYDDCEHIINGLIFVSDIEFNERGCEAKCKVEDNSYYAKIRNNMKLFTSLYSGKSKNGFNITAPTTYLSDLTDLSNNRENQNIPCIKVYDAFRYLVDFMSDGTLAFNSTAFGPGGAWEGLVVTNGYRIFNINATDQYQVSFDKLFDEINKRIPLIVFVENPLSAVPIIRIEELSYSYGSAQIQQHTDIYEIVTRTDNTLLYSKVKVGNSVTDDTLSNSFPENTPFYGWLREEYNLQINCNIDRALDLNVDYATACNVIERCIDYQDYQPNIFLLDTIVDTPGGYSGQVYAEDIFNIGTYFMNSRLNNASVLTRYIGGMPGDAANFYGATGDSYFSVNTTVSQVAVPVSNTSYNTISWNNEVSDPQNRFTSPKFTAFYTANYNFKIQIAWTLPPDPNWFVSTPNTDSYGKFDWHFEVRDGANNLKSRTFLYSTGNICGIHWDDGPNYYPPVGFNVQTNGASSIIDFSTPLLSTWYVQIVCINTVINPISNANWGTLNEFWRIDQAANSTWQSNQNSIGGGTFILADPNDYPIYLHKYDYPLSLSEWNTLVSNTVNKIGFNMSGQLIRNGWMKDISYNYNSGIASVQLISSKNAT